MKKNKNGHGQSRPVHLEITHPSATTVYVAGTFNDWRPAATPMVSLGGGRWMKELTLPAGKYEYCLIADGQWMPDPSASKTVPNPFGGLNSVLEVPNGASAGKGVTATN